MMNNTQSTVIGSNKTSRSCDSCLSKRALWFCAADDAFLCQSCDKSVHSANSLASRHERVRLEKESSSYNKAIDDELDPTKNRVSGISVYGSVVPPIWDQGITKKPRTPRFQKPKKGLMIKELNSNLMEVLVPEFDSEETFSPNENEEQLLNRVPVLDLLDVGISSNKSFDIADKDTEFDLDLLLNDHEVSGMNLFPGFMSTDELVIDVENYLSTNIEDDSCGFRGLYGGGEGCYEDKGMKVEEEESQILETAIDFYCDTVIPEEDMTRESSNWDFEDYSSSPLVDLEEELKINDKEKEVRRINLKLNHEAIICSWDCQSSPWMNGIKPEFNLNDSWPEFMGNGSTLLLIDEDPNGSKNRQFGSYGKDEEREARVLRYKEKRRTRLFSKKIRYQVRKLNAEKRPRMKGRFVKRTTAIVGFL